MLIDALTYSERHRDRFLLELKELLEIPSISALPENRPDMQRAAHWLADHFTAIGLKHAQVHPTPGHPIVTADWLDAGPDRPTVLIYGHYDVQPVDPIELWHSDPFRAEVRGDYLFGRGVSDDKGQLFIHAKVVEAYLKSTGQAAGQREAHHRRRRRSRRPQPRCVYHRQQRLPEGRRGGDQRHLDDQTRPAQPRLRLARPVLHSSGGDRPPARSALGPIRRRGLQSAASVVRDDRVVERSQRAHHHAGLLRQSRAAG